MKALDKLQAKVAELQDAAAINAREHDRLLRRHRRALDLFGQIGQNYLGTITVDGQPLNLGDIESFLSA